MKEIFFTTFVAATLGVVLVSMGCAKRTYYSSVFGQYTLSQAHKQYAQLFQMEQNRYEKFLTFKDGWWKIDVRKMKEAGISITDLCKRYCRTPNIKVPFPLLVDYQLM